MPHNHEVKKVLGNSYKKDEFNPCEEQVKRCEDFSDPLHVFR